MLVFHNQYSEHSSSSGKMCSGHHNGNSSENDDLPNDEQSCPVVIFSHGLIMPEASMPNHWEYVDYHSVQFIEPNSLSSVFSAHLTRQRAPPLV